MLVAVVAIVGWAAPGHAAVVRTGPDDAATFNGAVRAIAYAGSVVYLGGEFTRATYAGKTYPRSRLAALDARTGQLLGWAPHADNRVRGLVATADSVFAVGDFGTVNGVRRDSLVRLDRGPGTVLRGFAHAIGGVPHAVATGSGRLYLGGTITTVDGVPRGRLVAFELGTGAVDGGWAPVADGRVEALVATPDRVYLGGDFHSVNGVHGSARLAAVDPYAGGYDPTFRPAASYVVHAVALSTDTVYAAQGGPGGRLTAYTGLGAARWTSTTDGDVQAVGVLGDTIYLGGHFDNVCRSARTGTTGSCLDGSDRRVKLAALDPVGTLLPWAPQANGIEGVFALATNGGLGKTACGGTFTTIGGRPRARFAQFSG